MKSPAKMDGFSLSFGGAYPMSKLSEGLVTCFNAGPFRRNSYEYLDLRVWVLNGW